MVKISLLTDGIFPYVIGGMQKHSYYLAKYFAKNKIFVDLYHTNQSNLDINKLELFSEEEKKFINSFVIPFPSGGKLPGHYIKASYNYSELIFDVFKKQNPTDFIYAKGFSAWKLIEEKKKNFKCPPIGVNFHGYEMFQKPPDLKTYLASKLIVQKPVLYNVKNADYVFSYGAKITDIIKNIGTKSSKIIEIPTGIEEQWLTKNHPESNSTKIKFVFVGRFERRKGIEELNKALKIIPAKNKDFEFHFIGPIPQEKQILNTAIVYHGAINDAALMKDVISKMDVLVCPSHSEGMPNVIMEAMASGLAVIATNVGAVALMVNESNGFLLNDNNPITIANALTHCIGLDKNTLTIQKQASIDKVKNNFLWENIIQKTISEIQKKIA